SVLNGVSSEETIAARFGERNVIYCTAQGMDAVKVGNALTYAHAGMIVLGEKQPGGISPRVQQIADFLNTHGVTAQPVGDMVRRQWGKLMLNVGINQTVMVFEAITARFRSRVPREIMLAAMREVQKLAALEGYPISDAEFDNWVNLADSLSPAGKPSMRQDGEAHRKSEVELFAGTIIRRAEKFGLDVPVNRWLYDTVKQMEAGY
ncbi:MAG: ketopantoate reductase family protein, partial [Christensenellales bacterium]